MGKTRGRPRVKTIVMWRSLLSRGASPAASVAARTSALRTTCGGMQQRNMSSVFEARKQIFGTNRSEGASATPFTALKQLRRRDSGWLGPGIVAYYPTPHRMIKHPLYRTLRNDERLEEVEARKAVGKGPPKKGEGKRGKKK